MPTDVEIETRASGVRAVVSVAGDLDVYSAPQLRGELVRVVAAGTMELIIDLRRVEFMGSSGLGVLVGALKRVVDLPKRL